MRSVISSKWFNIVFFNLLWLGCVIGGNPLLWLTGPLLIIYLALLLKIHAVTLSQLALPVGLGIAVDGLLTMAGLFNFNSTGYQISGWPIPFWLMVLWVGFISTLPLSLAFLAKSKALPVLAGAIGFPFSYAMGERLGAVTFGVGFLEALVFLSLIWAVILPVMVYLVQRTGDYAHASS